MATPHLSSVVWRLPIGKRTCPTSADTAPFRILNVAVCEEGFYNSEEDGVQCVPCMLGTECIQVGVTRHSLPLLRGWWRPDSSSTQVYQCPDGKRNSSGCIGGTGPPCKPYLEGPYCRLCNSTGVQRFYDHDVSECSACSEKLFRRMAPTWAVGASVVILLLAAPRIGPSLHRTAHRRFPRLLTKWAPLKNKIRILWRASRLSTKCHFDIPAFSAAKHL